MANTIPSEFTPFVVGAMAEGRYIQKGGETASPYLKGMVDVASNHNYLLAKKRRALVNQSDSATIAYTSGTVKWAQYRIFSPKLVNRDSLAVVVTASCSAGTFEVRATTSAGSSSWSSPTGSGTVQMTVGLAYSGDTLELEFRMSGAGDFLPTRVRVFSTQKISGSTLTSAGSPYQQTYVYQDLDQYGVDRPLSVTQIRDLLKGAEGMQRECRRIHANWSAWFDWSTRDTYDGSPIKAPPDADNAFRTIPMREFVVTPREGTTRIEAYITARLDNAASVAGRVGLSHAPGGNVDLSLVTTAAADEVTSVLSLTSDARQFVTLRGRGGAGANEDLYVLAFTIWDKED